MALLARKRVEQVSPVQMMRLRPPCFQHVFHRRLPCVPVTVAPRAGEPSPKHFPVARPQTGQPLRSAPKSAVFVADSYKMFRDALAAVIHGAPDLQVAGEAATGEEAIRLCRRLKPDIVVISIELDGLHGIEATHQILRDRPDTKVILIQASPDEETTVRAIRSGALGLVFRDDPAAHLVEALAAVEQGQSYLGPLGWDSVLERFRREAGYNEAAHLSAAENKLLRLIASGKTGKEIASLLDVSEQSVYSQRRRLMQKMGA